MMPARDPKQCVCVLIMCDNVEDDDDDGDHDDDDGDDADDD